MMKVLFILFLFVCTLLGTNIDKFAKEMHFERDYAIALAKAKKENKVLVIVLSADYCPWCRKFERKVLNSQLIKVKLDEEFITLVVDNKYDIKTFPAKFKTHYTPMSFMINPHNENILEESPGYVKKNAYHLKLKSAQKLFKENKS